MLLSICFLTENFPVKNYYLWENFPQSCYYFRTISSFRLPFFDKNSYKIAITPLD